MAAKDNFDDLNLSEEDIMIIETGEQLPDELKDDGGFVRTDCDVVFDGTELIILKRS